MVSPYRQEGFHDHHTNNIPGLNDAIDARIAGASIPAGGSTGQALVKDSGTDGDATWHNIEDIVTAETDDTLVLAPDGAGGVEFRAETGGAGTPSATVSDETSFGISPSAGSSTDYSRGDHTHGTPASPGGGSFSGARAYNSSNLSANNNTETPLTLNSERYDTASYHSTSSNTSRFTAPVTGYYHIGGNVYWDSNTSGSRDTYLKVNNTDIIAIQHGPASPADAQQNVNCDYFLTSGDYVELFVFQNSGGTRTITSTGKRSPEFWIHLIGT